MQEKIIETKICKHCNSKFDITDKDLEFYEKVSPVFSGKKYSIPTPALCSDCRQQRRLNFRNERNLYKRICNATGKPIISMYSPDKQYIIYDEIIWWSDKWNVLDYGKDFDFNKNFFLQFDELIKKVPHNNLINNYLTNENSSYGNFTGNNKDCYLTFETGSLEYSYYSESSRKSKNILDCAGCFYCENSSYLIDCYNCNKCYFCIDSNYCINSKFLFDCKNCENCFMCYNLNNKKYCIRNKQYSKKEYLEELTQTRNNKSYDELREEFLLNKSKKICIYRHGFGNENCSGDYIYNSKNSKNCYNARNLENCKYCSVMSSSSDKTTNCYDYDYFGSSELSYEIITVGSNAQNVIFTVNSWENTANLIYCYNCIQSKNCFGCFSVTNKEYCIFNKQYTKEEYSDLVPKIIKHMMKTGEWGEFFPASISPFGYNETLAFEYYPLTKNIALKENFKWSDYEIPILKVDKIIPANKLPENIKDIPDDILNRAIECEITKKPFRIIKQELDFYRKHNLPIPRRHPDLRHLDRMALRNPRKLFDRKCDKCGIEIKTTYNPERLEIIYCEECYNKEIY